MKNSKILVPVVLAVLLVLSVYMKVDADVQINKEYDNCIDAAHYAVENDIFVDAVDYYNQAIEIKPSLDLYIEVGEYLKTQKSAKLVQEWAEDVISIYPKEPKAYEFAVKAYAETGDYKACFSAYNTAMKRKSMNENIEKIISEVEYEYFFSGGEYTDVSVFSCGLCAVTSKTKWGFVYENGAPAIQMMFDDVGAFVLDRAPVITSEGDVYYIDADGNKKVVIPGVKNVKKLNAYNDNFLTGYDGTTWKFYSHEGKELFGGYSDISAFANGLGAVKKDGKWYIIDANGANVVDKGFSDIKQDEKGIIVRYDRLFVKENGGYYMIDTKGNRIGDAEYQNVHIFYDSNYAAVQINSKWGFIDKDGKEIIKPQYEAARSFSNGYAAVRFGNKWGFIDVNGNLVINYTFADAKDFTESGSVYVNTGEYWELLRLYKYNYQ